MDAIYYLNHEIQPVAYDDVPKYLQKPEGILWVDIDANNADDAAALEKFFHFHPLAIEDVMHRHQRPKADEYENNLFVIVNPIAEIGSENIFRELDIFIGKNFMVTAHHGKEPVVAAARHRLNQFHVPFSHLPTYILYVLLDTLVDGYFPQLEEIEKKIDRLSDEALEKADRKLLKEISSIKTRLNEIWWVIFPQQDIITFLMQHEEYFVDERSRYYLRDVSDHLSRILTATQAARETINGLINIYMGAVSIRLNVAVNRLTVFTVLIGVSTVFAGFYGMNFEVTWPPFNADWGVPAVLFMMIFVTVAILLYMRWQKWIE